MMPDLIILSPIATGINEKHTNGVQVLQFNVNFFLSPLFKTYASKFRYRHFVAIGRRLNVLDYVVWISSFLVHTYGGLDQQC